MLEFPSFEDFEEHETETINERTAEVIEQVYSAHDHLDRDKHGDLVLAYAASVDRMERAIRESNVIETVTVPSTKGTMMIHPAIRVARDEASLVAKLAKDLGLAPTSVPVLDEEDEAYADILTLKAELSA